MNIWFKLNESVHCENDNMYSVKKCYQVCLAKEQALFNLLKCMRLKRI